MFFCLLFFVFQLSLICCDTCRCVAKIQQNCQQTTQGPAKKFWVPKFWGWQNAVNVRTKQRNFCQWIVKRQNCGLLVLVVYFCNLKQRKSAGTNHKFWFRNDNPFLFARNLSHRISKVCVDKLRYIAIAWLCFDITLEPALFKTVSISASWKTGCTVSVCFSFQRKSGDRII